MSQTELIDRSHAVGWETSFLIYCWPFPAQNVPRARLVVPKRGLRAVSEQGACELMPRVGPVSRKLSKSASVVVIVMSPVVQHYQFETIGPSVRHSSLVSLVVLVCPQLQEETRSILDVWLRTRQVLCRSDSTLFAGHKKRTCSVLTCPVFYIPGLRLV